MLDLYVLAVVLPKWIANDISVASVSVSITLLLLVGWGGNVHRVYVHQQICKRDWLWSMREPSVERRWDHERTFFALAHFLKPRGPTFR